MKLYLFLFALCVCSVSFAQITENELSGSWSVENVNTNFKSVSEEQQAVIDELIAAFEDATFQFNDSRDFKITIDYDDISNQMKNAYWKLDSKNLVVTIIDWEDKDTDAPSWEWPITISIEEDKTFFTLLGANFKLEVTKQ